MTIVVFLIDTSASMNQRVYLGGRPTLLDVAKGAVETFVKVRQRSQESRADRYMLLTFEDPPANIKAGWKENLLTFMNELKNLQCVGMTTMGAALRHTFDVLNINRMQTGIDTYGQGRCPYFLEPAVIVAITDGGKLSSSSGVQEDFNLPMHSPIPGSELTREPFRWDQRLFSLVLRLAGTPALDRDIGLVPSDNSPIDAMCEVTGGRSYCVTSHRVLLQCIDSLVQKVHNGVVINFEKIGPDPPPVANDVNLDDESEPRGLGDKDLDKEYINLEEEDGTNRNGTRSNNMIASLNSSTAWHSCRRMIYVPKSSKNGFWPMPESFWPDLNSSSLPPRTAHPNVKFTCTSQEPMVIENLPFDKYELEPSPLTQYILARKQPTVCWQVFVTNSYKNSEVGHPFGYLKASTNLSCVNLFVMPYNYPVLLPLLDELFKIHRLKPTAEWRTQFQNYLRTLPIYYVSALRRALTRMGVTPNLVQVLIPETQDNSLSYSVINYLKRLKNQAKLEYERLCNDVSSKAAANIASGGKAPGVTGLGVSATEGVRVTPRTPLKKDLVSHPLLQDKFTYLREQLNEFGGFVVGLSRGHCQRGRQSYRNPYDIPRRSLLDQVVRMRSNFLQPDLSHTRLLDDDFAHSMPVSQMGNYQDYLKRAQRSELREIESAPVRQHMFGNPFKIDKRMMVDEADIDVMGGQSTSNKAAMKRSLSQTLDPLSPRLPPKRKPGPLPKSVFVRRPTPSPCSTPPLSPIMLLSDDPLPPILMPMFPQPGLLSSGVPSDPMRDDLILSGGLDSGGDGPPKLTIMNGDIGDLGLHLHLGALSDLRPRSPSPPGDSMLPPILEPVTNHVAEYEGPFFPVHHLSLSSANHMPLPNEIGSNHMGSEGFGATHARLNNNSVVVQPSKRELEEIDRHNRTVRRQVYRELKKPGRNFTTLFAQLETLRGSLDVRVGLLREVKQESLRFKRQHLATLLEDFVVKMLAATNHNTVNNHRPPNNNGAARLNIQV